MMRHCTKAVCVLFLLSLSACADWQPYKPAPGDIIVSTNPDRDIQAKYRMLGAGPPTHSSIVTYVWTTRGADLCMLESVIDRGVVAVPFSELSDPTRTNVCVRTLRVPLTPREVARLADWATDQRGKPYPPEAKVYLSAIRGRPVRLLHLRPIVSDDDWFCSGLVAAGIIVTGRVNGAHIRPELVMPLDLVEDRELDLSPQWTKPRPWRDGQVFLRKRGA